MPPRRVWASVAATVAIFGACAAVPSQPTLASPVSGMAPYTLTLQSSGDAQSFYYTLDGSTPAAGTGTQSTSGTVTVPSLGVYPLKAVAVDASNVASTVADFTITVFGPRESQPDNAVAPALLALVLFTGSVLLFLGFFWQLRKQENERVWLSFASLKRALDEVQRGGAPPRGWVVGEPGGGIPDVTATGAADGELDAGAGAGAGAGADRRSWARASRTLGSGPGNDSVENVVFGGRTTHSQREFIQQYARGVPLSEAQAESQRRRRGEVVRRLSKRGAAAAQAAQARSSKAAAALGTTSHRTHSGSHGSSAAGGRPASGSSNSLGSGPRRLGRGGSGVEMAPVRSPSSKRLPSMGSGPRRLDRSEVKSPEVEATIKLRS
mmetsp:Transcript_2911/g.8904  ORF Transcript_2911/g.8904 Transcript_2911/m.8904 type:complete len:380 (-) Transcript_2911:15-1154(-)